MDDLVNGVVTTSVVLGGVVGIARTIVSNQRRADVLRQAGICERCKGTGIQECQLCYGVGSIARPGYINIADPVLRRKCRRCDGFGRHSCSLCGAANELVRSEPPPPRTPLALPDRVAPPRVYQASPPPPMTAQQRPVHRPSPPTRASPPPPPAAAPQPNTVNVGVPAQPAPSSTGVGRMSRRGVRRRGDAEQYIRLGVDDDL